MKIAGKNKNSSQFLAIYFSDMYFEHKIKNALSVFKAHLNLGK